MRGLVRNFRRAARESFERDFRDGSEIARGGIVGVLRSMVDRQNSVLGFRRKQLECEVDGADVYETKARWCAVR